MLLNYQHKRVEYRWYNAQSLVAWAQAWVPVVVRFQYPIMNTS